MFSQFITVHNVHMERSTARWLVILLSVTAAFCALAQRIEFEGHDDGPRPDFPSTGEFHFVRLEYNDLPQFHRRWGYASRSGQGNGWWIVDWPDAEDHFTSGIQRLTRIAAGESRNRNGRLGVKLRQPGRGLEREHVDDHHLDRDGRPRVRRHRAQRHEGA